MAATSVLDLPASVRRGRIYVALAAVAWSSAGVLQRELTVGTATQLAFTIQPPTAVTVLSDTFQVEVTAEDSSGSLVPSFTGDVTVAIGTDGSVAKNAQLRGATHASLVNGIATFPNLSIDQTGVMYTLKASVPRLTDATSRPFNVLAVP